MKQEELDEIISDLKKLKDSLFNGDNIGKLRNAIETLETVQITEGKE